MTSGYPIMVPRPIAPQPPIPQGSLMDLNAIRPSIPTVTTNYSGRVKGPENKPKKQSQQERQMEKRQEKQETMQQRQMAFITKTRPVSTPKLNEPESTCGEMVWNTGPSL